ncbi:MAG: hypothetical protein WAS34_18870 [Thiolinea sp.]
MEKDTQENNKKVYDFVRSKQIFKLNYKDETKEEVHEFIPLYIQDGVVFSQKQTPPCNILPIGIENFYENIVQKQNTINN